MDNAHTPILLGNFDSVFQWQLISKGMWSTRSPDFIPHDFLLWGFLNKAVYILFQSPPYTGFTASLQ